MPIRRQCIERGCTRTAVSGARCRECRCKRNSNNYYLSPAWRRLRKLVLVRDSGRCVVCSSTIRLFVHHVKGRVGGGADAINNLITLCQACHNRYEGDLRAGRDTEHRRLIDRIAEQLLG